MEMNTHLFKNNFGKVLAKELVCQLLTSLDKTSFESVSSVK